MWELEAPIIANFSTESLDPLSVIASRLPKKPYCSDNLSFGVKIHASETAKRKAYIQLNHPWLHQVIAIDVDWEESGAKWIDGHVPPPNVLVVNRENGHSHYLYVLKYPVSIKNAKAWKYLVNVSNALTVGLEGDPYYVGMIQKNPFSKVWETRIVEREGYELGELWREAGCHKIETKKRELVGESRNCELFDELRRWAYVEKRTWMGSREEWERKVRKRAEGLNGFDRPLSLNEVEGIGKSVAKWVWKNYTGTGEERPLGGIDRDKIHSKNREERLGEEEAKERMAEGARYRNRIQGDRTRERIVRVIGELVGKGERVTKVRVAEKTGLSRQVLWRYEELFSGS